MLLRAGTAPVSAEKYRLGFAQGRLRVTGSVMILASGYNFKPGNCCWGLNARRDNVWTSEDGQTMGRLLCVLLLAAISLIAQGSGARAEPTDVSIPAPRAAKGDFTGLLFRPNGAGPFPAVVAMHGCGGLWTKSGGLAAREKDWAERFVGAGYVVLFADSFKARGIRQICSEHERDITPADRADDAKAAADWLAAQPYVDKARLGLMGWSHGAMSVLAALSPGLLGEPPRYKVAIAMYPGCRKQLQQANWRPSVPLSLFIGAADDWTQPGPCRELAEREGFRFVAYPGAYHGFDSPNSPVRVRKNVGSVRSGEAHVGTDPAARAAAIAEIMETLAKRLAPTN